MNKEKKKRKNNKKQKGNIKKKGKKMGNSFIGVGEKMKKWGRKK